MEVDFASFLADAFPILLVAFASSVLIVRFYTAVALRARLAAPADPWHDKPVAQSGGVALWATVLVGVAVLRLYREPYVAPLLGAAIALVVVGWIDDRRPFQPLTKLVLQLAISVALLATGYGMAPMRGVHVAVAFPIAVVWLVGQSNAVNLLDNMDGACPSVVVVIALSCAAQQYKAGAPGLATLCALVAGATAGFLVWNRKPARVFLGDTGSLSLGFLLAAIAMNGAWFGSGAQPTRVFLPLLLLIVPLLNTAFVVVTRHDSGVPVSRGLAGHINYRLVAHGLSTNRALLALASISLVGGGLVRAWWTITFPMWCSLVALFVLGIAYFAIFLSHANVRAVYERLRVPLGVPSSTEYRATRRRVFEIFADIILGSAAYFLAFKLRFDAIPDVQEKNLVHGLPVAVVAGVLSAAANGMYRVFWKYFGMDEVVRLARVALGVGFVLYVATLLPTFSYFPRSVYFLDPMLFFIFTGGSRLSLRLLHEWRSIGGNVRRRALVVGAGDAGELAVRDIRNGSFDGLQVCGFVDDDPSKLGMTIHGVEVIAPVDQLLEAARERNSSLIVVAMPSASAERVRRVVDICDRGGLELRFFMRHAVPERRFTVSDATGHAELNWNPAAPPSK